MIDGVYSMYGDFAPIKPLYELLNQYKKLHIYADDAHGMGWMAEKGKGYILSQVELHPKLILATSLNKAFGAGGGVFVFYDKELALKVKKCGASFIFSAPHSMPVLGAAIASAKIFLSKELYIMQHKLERKVNYCQTLLEEYGLPVVSNPQTPIFFIGLGLVRVGYNMVKKMLDEGYFVNLSAFPAVPESCTGLRFTITLHHTYEDIEMLVKALAKNFQKALREEERTIEDVYRAFRRVASFKEAVGKEVQVIPISQYQVQHETTIKNIAAELWDSLLGKNGTFDYKGLLLLENAFTNNPKKEDNWRFHYYIIRDNKGFPLLATFLTVCFTKDDMLAPMDISKELENQRIENPYFLTSKSLMMGSLITEGQHLYLDRGRKDWKNVLMLLLDEIWKLQDREKTSMLYLRDFDTLDLELCDFLKDQGFIMYNLPHTHSIQEKTHTSIEKYTQELPNEKRYYINKRVLNHESYYETSITNKLSNEDLDNIYQLYKNVASKSLEVNNFILPKKLFNEIVASGEWEFIILYLKPEVDKRETRKPVGMAINYSNKQNYNFLLTGIDYCYNEQYNVYSQILWQIVKRAKELGLTQIHLGFTASQNKRKFGATAIPKSVFIQMKDNYNMTLIELMPGKKMAI